MDKTYKVGEYIILDSGERGEVVEIGIRSTRIKTRDDVIVTIPNSIMANSKIINESAPIPRFRIRVPVGVAYGSNLERVEEILLTVTGANENIEKHPEPRVRLRTFADSSVNFELLCWVKDPRDKGLQIHQLLKAAYNAFDDQGITIPFPQRDIHIKSSQPDAIIGSNDSANSWDLRISAVEMPLVDGLHFFHQAKELSPDRISFFQDENLRYLVKPSTISEIRGAALSMLA